MNVSIIIPTRNRVATLEETISNVFTKQKYLNSLEVIIINDGDELPAGLTQKYKSLKIVKNAGAGAASARNTGANMAKNELLLFIDDDILISDDCIERHIKIHTDFPQSIVSGTWIYEKPLIEVFKSTPFGRYKLINDYTPLEGKEENKIANGIYKSNSLASFNLSILKKNFLELGGFNTNFPFAGCEDQEFTLRAAEKGYSLLLDKNNININNEKDRAILQKWLTRQYTGVQGYILLCELFPYRKQEALYKENGIIQKGDSSNIAFRKRIKYFLSLSPFLQLIQFSVRILELVNTNDRTLFKLYNGLCGLYIYKGFLYAQKEYLKKNERL